MPSKLTKTINGETVEFEVVYRRKQKRIIVRPTTDGYIISAPKRTPLKTLSTMIDNHKEPIKNLTPRIDFNQTLEHPKVLQIFGTIYPVIYKERNGGVFFEDESVIVCTKALNKDNVKRLLRKFLQTILLDEVEAFHQNTKQHYPKYPLDQVKFSSGYAHSKFGSCYYRKRTIRFNLALVHYPKVYLHYIYHHEITHLRHPDHSRDFYRTFSRFSPNYKTLKIELEKTHEQYMRDIKNHI